MKGKGLLLVLVLVSVSLSGCAPEYERPSLEDLALIGVMGFDYMDQEKVKVSVSLPAVSPSRNKELTQIYTTTASLTSEAMLTLATKAERTMSLAQLRVILFSEEYARKVGLGRIILDLYRNPIVGENVYIAIVKGTAEEIVSGDYSRKPTVNIYLNNLLRPRVESAFSSFTTLHDFVFMMTSQTRDPNLPYLIKNGEDVEIAKVALMRKDKMVGSYSQREGKLVQIILGRKRLPRMNFTFLRDTPKGKKAEQIVFDFIWSKAKVRSNGSLTKPKITIQVKLKGRLVGYKGDKDMQNEKQVKAMTQELEKAIKNELISLVRRFQKQRVDPAALEESLRQNYRGEWKRDIGLALYQKAEFDVKTELEITGYGTIK